MKEEEKQEVLLNGDKSRKLSGEIEMVGSLEVISVNESQQKNNDESRHNSGNRLKGIIIMLISKWFFATTFATWKGVYNSNPHMTGFDYIMFRSGIWLGIAALEAVYYRQNVLKVPKNWYLAIFFSFTMGALGIPAFYVSLKYLPVSQAGIMVSTIPLMTAIFVYFLGNEELTVLNIISIIGAFIGVTLTNMAKSESSSGSETELIYIIAVILCLISWVYRAAMPIANRHINKHLHTVVFPFWLSVGMFCAAVCLLLFFNDLLNFQHYRLNDWIAFILSSFSNYLAITTTSISYKYETATVLAPLAFVQTFMLLMIDIFIFGYEFKMMYFVGFSLVVVFVGVPIFHKLLQGNS